MCRPGLPPEFEEQDVDHWIDVVRVKIDTALEFVLGPIRREREASPDVGLAAETEGRQHLETCEKWADIAMAHVGQVSIDTNGFTWEAVCRAKAMLNREAFDEHQVSLLWDHLAAYAFLDAALSDYGNFDSIAIESQTTSRWGVRIRLRSSPRNIVTAN
ncbi:hypothetical protein F4824DRAFT_505645 [Ustulina deusta]|nr:hypothetical protein F4824DRAFT_505645 [Ustulina deusta]